MPDADGGHRQLVELPRLDRAEFAYYLGWAHRLGMVDHWPVFECELHAAVTVALGLHDIPTDLDDVQASWVADVHRWLSLQLLDAQTACDPATRWEDFLERLWSGCRQLAIDLPVGAHGIVARLERDLPTLDDHGEPGIPLRLLPWLERVQFQRSVTDTYRDQRPDDWPSFRYALCRTLPGAFGLNGSWADRGSSGEVARIDGRQQHLAQRLDQARERFDPAAHWEEFREIVWAGRNPGPATR
jgi:hypothetical protein